MKTLFSILAVMALLFMPMQVGAEQGELTVGVVNSNGEIDLGNDGLTAGININDGMFEDSVSLPTFDNVLEIKRTGVIVEYGITDNFSVSSVLGVQDANTTGLIEINQDFAIGYETDTAAGFYWEIGTEYQYPLLNGLVPFISGAYSQGKNDVEGVTLSALGVSVTLPDAVNEIGGMFSSDISAEISGDITVKKLKGMLGVKYPFEFKTIKFTPFVAVSYLYLDVDTDVAISATDGWNDAVVGLNAQNSADKDIGVVIGVSTKITTFLASSIEASLMNERGLGVMGSLCFKF